MSVFYISASVSFFFQIPHTSNSIWYLSFSVRFSSLGLFGNKIIVFALNNCAFIFCRDNLLQVFEIYIQFFFSPPQWAFVFSFLFLILILFHCKKVDFNQFLKRANTFWFTVLLNFFKPLKMCYGNFLIESALIGHFRLVLCILNMWQGSYQWACI